MSFFKDMRELKRQAKETQRAWDPATQIAHAQASMAQASEMMARQTTAAAVAVNGLDATATVAGVRQGPATVNFQPMVDVDLTVLAPGGPPYPATVSQLVPQVHLARVQPGAALRVKVDPADRNSIWIDFAAA